MHTLVRVKNAYTVMTICLIALGAALLFAPQLGLTDSDPVFPIPRNWTLPPLHTGSWYP